jgi:cell wall-associated NlpC family hydrolase
MINDIISKYLGVPYKFQGNTIEEGLDCVNLCTQVGKDLGVTIPNVNHTMSTPDSYSSLFDLRQNLSLWKEVRPKANTLCVFKINGVVKHVGYMLNEYNFIHIMEHSKVTVDSIDSIQWSRRLVNCYEYVGKDLEI